MADIFGYNRSGAAGVFVSDKAKLNISGAEGVDLIQGWSLTYQQQISPLYEIGSSRIWWAKSAPIGQGSISTIIGNSLLKIASNQCDTGGAATISNANGACDSNKTVRLTMTGLVVTSVGFQAQAGNPTVAEQVGFQFASLALA